MLKNLKKPLLMGAIGLVALGGLTACDDDQSPSNPKNFPSRTHMTGVARKWHPVVLGNAVRRGDLPAGVVSHCWPLTNNVRWAGDRWSLDLSCQVTLGEGGPLIVGGPDTITAHADWTKDWITGSRYQ